MGIRESVGRWLLRPQLEQLRRFVEAGSVESMLAEPGWEQLGGESSPRDFAPVARKTILANSRYYWAHDPLAGQAVRLYRDYVLGSGLTWTAKDPRVREVVEAFWSSPRNLGSFTRFEAQQKLIERLAVEGEMFLCLHVSKTSGRVVVRTIPPEEIVEVVTADGDDEWPLYYQRSWSEKAWDYGSHAWRTESKARYYRDVSNADDGHDEMSDGGTERLVVHVALNTLGKRGVPILSRAIPWIKAHKGFLEDRVTLTLALATFAFRQKVKGSKAAVDRLRGLWDNENLVDRYAAGAHGGLERAPGARTLLENEAVTLEQIRTDSGASAAYTDGRMLLHEVCAATGIFEHYFGNPETGNLATATAMELPLLKMFESWQRLVGGIYLTVLEVAVHKAIEYGDLPGEVEAVEEGGVKYKAYTPGNVNDEEGTRELDTAVGVDFPPIVQRDVPAYVNAVVQAIASGALGAALADPRYREGTRLLLQALGVPNVEEVISKAEEALAKEETPSPALLSRVEALKGLLEEVLRGHGA